MTESPDPRESPRPDSPQRDSSRPDSPRLEPPPRDGGGQHRTPRAAWWRGELPFLTVLGCIGLGLAIVGLHHFKRGSVLIAAALVLAAVLRVVLSDRQAGMLAVRGRVIDAASLCTLGALTGVAAAIVPPP